MKDPKVDICVAHTEIWHWIPQGQEACDVFAIIPICQQ